MRAQVWIQPLGVIRRPPWPGQHAAQARGIAVDSGAGEHEAFAFKWPRVRILSGKVADGWRESVSRRSMYVVIGQFADRQYPTWWRHRKCDVAGWYRARVVTHVKVEQLCKVSWGARSGGQASREGCLTKG
jgi:hypothetical protein